MNTGGIVESMQRRLAYGDLASVSRTELQALARDADDVLRMLKKAAFAMRSLEWLNGELGATARQRCAALADEMDALIKRVEAK